MSAGSDADQARANDSAGKSAFDTLLDSATPPAAPTPPRSNPSPDAGANGPATGQTASVPATDPDVAPVENGPANPANAAPDAARLASAGGWTGQGRPEFVGDTGLNASTTAASDAGTRAAAGPAIGAAATAAPDVPATLAQPGPKPALAKTLDATTASKTIPGDGAAPAAAATNGVPAPASSDPAVTQPAPGATATDKSEKPPVMAVLSPSNPAPQSRASAPAVTTEGSATTNGNPAETQPTPGAPAMAKSEKPPVMAVLSPSNPAPQSRSPAPAAVTIPAMAGTDPTAPAAPAVTATPAQSQAAATVNPAVAEANPAGRFAQARQGVDERDGKMAAAGTKGQPTASTAGQAGAKHQATGASAQPQTSAANPAAARPDSATTSRELPVSAPPPPAAAAAPLAADAGRVSSVSLDPAMTTMIDTGSSAARMASRSAAEAGTSQTPRFTPHAAKNLAGQISQRFANGSRVFGIRLDPAELGRVDIRLEVSQNNRVHATLTVERGDTLAEMQRSTRDLERALNDAGLELDEDGLNFELSEGSGDQNFAEAEQGSNFNVYGPDEDGAQELGAEIESGPADAYGFRLSRRDGVDLRV